MGDGSLIRPQQWTPEQYDAIKRAVDSGSIADPKRVKYAVNALAAYEVANKTPLPDAGRLQVTDKVGPKASAVVRGAAPPAPAGAPPEPAGESPLAAHRAELEKGAGEPIGAAKGPVEYGTDDRMFTTAGKPGASTTFVRQAGDAATFGLGAKMAGLGGRIAAAMDTTRGGEGVGESGDAVRDEYRDTDAASAKENPKAAFLGQISGGMLPAMAAGGLGAAARAGAAGDAVANAARPVAQRLGSAAVSGMKTGAAYGAASGLGHSDVRSGEDAGANAERMAGDTAIGGGMGAATGGIVSTLGELLLGGLRSIGAGSWKNAQDFGKNPKTAPQMRDFAAAGGEPMPAGQGFQKALRPGPQVQAELDAANASGGASPASERTANRAALTARDVINDVTSEGKQHTEVAKENWRASPESKRSMATQPLVDELDRMIRGQQLKGPMRTAIHPEVEPGSPDVSIPRSPRPIDPARAAQEAADAETNNPFPSSETTPKPRGYKVVDPEGNTVSEHADVASATEAQRAMAADLERRSPRPVRGDYPSDQEYIKAVESFLGEGPSAPGTPVEKDLARANSALTNRVDVRPMSSPNNPAVGDGDKQFWHHVTTAENLDSIAGRGLTMDGKSRQGVKQDRLWFSSPDTVQEWVSKIRSYTGKDTVELRTSSNTVGLGGEKAKMRWRREGVPPEDLEYKTADGQWRPLQEATGSARKAVPPGPANESLATVRPMRMGTRKAPERVVHGEYEEPPAPPPAKDMNFVQSDEPVGQSTQMAFSQLRELRKIRDALKVGEIDGPEFENQLENIRSKADSTKHAALKGDLDKILLMMRGSKDGSVPGMRQQVWPTLHEIQTSSAGDIDKQKAVRQALGVGDGDLGSELVGNAVSALSNAVLSTKELTRGALGSLMEHDPALEPLVRTARGTKAYEKLIANGADPNDALEVMVLRQISGGGMLARALEPAKEGFRETTRGLKNLAPPRRMTRAAGNVAGGQQKEE